MKSIIAILFNVCLIQASFSQTLYVPSGTVGTSPNSNVGIGISNPSEKLDIEGVLKINNNSDSWRLLTNSGGSFSIKETGFAGAFNIYKSGSANNSLLNLYNGMIGIGTTTPVNKLHLNNLNNDGINLDNKFRLRTSTTSSDFVLEHIANDGNLYIRSMEAGDNSGNLIFNDLGGNVGIGTSNPRFNLDIKSNTSYEGNNLYFGDRRFYLAGITGTGSQMYGGMVLTNLGSGIRSLDFVVGNNDFDSNSSPENLVMRIKSNGKVGIGTEDTGSHKLAVGGSIGAREIKVEASGWSDFVFYDDYKLRTLKEVEYFISENKHLPEIPSEEDVAEHGINLGEMNAKLLQKIEELTLYLIEQNKQNQAQQAKIEQLEKKITQLENE